MIKKFCFLFTSLLSFSAYAEITTSSDCGQALATDNPGFCESFKTVATCHCLAKGYPGAVCKDMKLLYQAMLIAYWSQENACKKQNETTYKTCMDDWNCYRKGGKNTYRKLCSSTGDACQ